MRRIYEIRSHFADRKGLQPRVGTPWDYFHGDRKLLGWQPMEVWCPHPEKMHFCDVSLFHPGTLLSTADARESLDQVLQSANVELLPQPFEGRQFYILNPLEIADCAEVIELSKRGEPGSLRFIPERIGAPMFKLRQMPYGAIYVMEKTGDPATEFKAAVEHHKLTGIRFKWMWSDQSPEERTTERIRNRPPTPPRIHDLAEVFDYAAWRGEEQSGPLVRKLLDAASPREVLLACNSLMVWLKTGANLHARNVTAEDGAHGLIYKLHPFAPVLRQLIESSTELQRLFQVAEVKHGLEPGLLVDFRPEVDAAQRVAVEEYALKRSQELWQ